MTDVITVVGRRGRTRGAGEAKDREAPGSLFQNNPLGRPGQGPLGTTLSMTSSLHSFWAPHLLKSSTASPGPKVTRPEAVWDTPPCFLDS